MSELTDEERLEVEAGVAERLAAARARLAAVNDPSQPSPYQSTDDDPDFPHVMAREAGVPDAENVIGYQPSPALSCRIWTYRDGSTYCSSCKAVSLGYADNDDDPRPAVSSTPERKPR